MIDQYVKEKSEMVEYYKEKGLMEDYINNKKELAEYRREVGDI